MFRCLQIPLLPNQRYFVTLQPFLRVTYHIDIMFTVIGVMFCGILTGLLLRNRKMVFTGQFITVLIWLLLFFLGIEVGGNRRIIEGIASLGIEAVIITIPAVLGSCIAAWGLWYMVEKRKGGGGNER